MPPQSRLGDYKVVAGERLSAQDHIDLLISIRSASCRSVPVKRQMSQREPLVGYVT